MNNPVPDPFDTNRIENTLAESLQARWPEREITDHQVQTLLAKLETQNRKQTNPMQTRITNTLRPLIYIGGLALLVLVLSWIFGSIRPSPASENTTPTALTTEGAQITNGENPDPRETPTPTGEEAVAPDDLPTPTPEPSPLPASPANGFNALPNVTFDFGVPLPEAPDQLTFYQEQLGGPLSEDAVRQMANQMGLNGEITSSPGEGGDTLYTVTDGDLQMIFFGFPGQFSYFINLPASSTLAEPLPFDQRVAIAEDFLNAHGLLTFPYRTEPSLSDPNGVRFVQLLDQIPLIYGIGYNPGLIEWITVSVNADGQVHSLFHSLHNFQPLGDLPILTAEQAWARLAQPNAMSRARYAVLAPPISWTQPGPEPTEALTGWLDNQNGANIFYADDGRILTLADPPADMIPSPVLSIYGTVTGEVISWTEITITDSFYGSSNSCGGGGGGGWSYFENANFGSGGFGFISLDPNAPALDTDYVSPIQPGDGIENVQGVLYIIHHIQAGGSENNLYNFWFAGDETTPGWTAYLEGEALTGIESLQNLPIKVWGTVTRIDTSGQAVITVDRYEEAYPGMRIQAWLGTEQTITLDGQEVVVLAAQDGSQYVLSHSIEWGPDGSLVGVAGDTVVIEGYILPDKTFGGYPVIYELSAGVENGRTDLSDYVITSNLINIQDDSSRTIDPAANLTGHVTIETAELMYAAISLDRCTPEFGDNPDFASFLYVQPIWRFTGHFDDGRSFEVQIQALTDEYLK